MNLNYASICGRVCFRTAVVLIFSFHALCASAQTAPSEDVRQAPSNEAVTLSPFQVSTARDYGYRAANALSATGTGMAIMDTPVTMNVVTRDFIDDIGSANLKDALQYVPGVNTSSRNPGTVVVRGFSPGNRSEYGATGLAIGGGEFIDRVEIMKGPNAIFFGRVAPGGVINRISKQPMFSRQGTVDVAYGSYDYKKIALDLTGPLSSRLAYRLVGYVLDKGDGYEDFTSERGKGLKADVLFQPFVGTTLRVQASSENQKWNRIHSPARTSSDYVRISSPNGVFDPTVVFNGISSSLAPNVWVTRQNALLKAAGAPDLYYIDSYAHETHPRGKRAHFDGPDAFKTLERDSLYAALEHRFNDTFSGKVEYSRSHSKNETLESSWFPRPDGVSAGQRPVWNGNAGSDAWSAETEWVAQFNVGPSVNRFLLGADISEGEGRSWSQTLPPVTFDFSQGAIYRISEEVGPLVRTANGVFSWSRTSGLYGVGVTRLFDERLVLLYGARRTRVVQGVNGTVAPTNAVIAPYRKSGGRIMSDDTFQVGAVYKVTPQLSLFAGLGETYEPQTAISVDGQRQDPVAGEGWEVGAKSDFLESRLSATLSVFRNERIGIANRDFGREIAEGRSPYFIAGGSEATEGAELELFFAPTRNYQTMLGFTHLWTAETIANAENAYLVGRGLQFTPKTTVSFWNRYTFTDGMLKNLTIGGGIRYNGKHEALANLDWFRIINPSWVRFDLLAAYETRLFGQRTHLQLNVENLTDKYYYDGEYVAGRPLSATLRIRFTF